MQSAITQLQDIKEEEDIEMTRLNTNESSSTGKLKESSTSSSSLNNVNDSYGDEHDLKEQYELRISLPESNNEEVKLRVGKGNSRDDLSLLPPLPKTIEHVIDQLGEDTESSADESGSRIMVNEKNNKNKIIRNQSNIITGTTSNIHSHVENDDQLVKNDGDILNNTNDASFDLSKALEMPATVHNNNTSNNSDSSLSLPPIVTSPKVSLKKKFSSVILNAEMSLSTPIPLPQDGSPNEISQLHDSKTHAVRCKSNSNATSFQQILPTLNMAIDATSIDSGHDNTNYHAYRGSQERRSLRKFSIGDSSNSSYSNTSISDELLYKIPPPKLNHNSRSRSRSNSNSNMISSSLSIEGLNISSTPTTTINTPSTSKISMFGDLNTKKVPLLRRASTAILRKTSLRGTACLSDREIPRSASASTTPILRSSSFFEIDMTQRTPPSRKNYCNSINEYDHIEKSTDYFHGGYEDSPDDELRYVTQLNRASRTASRNSSIGSRVKRSFSRIISSGNSVKRAVSSSSIKGTLSQQEQEEEQEQEQIQQSNPGMLASSPLFTSSSNTNGSSYHNESLNADVNTNDNSNSSKSSPIRERGKGKEIVNNVTPVSTSTMMSPAASQLMQMSDSVDKNQGPSCNGSTMDYFNLSQNDINSNVAKNKIDADRGKPLPLVSEIRRNTSVRNKNNRKKLYLGNASNENDVTIDLDKLTQSIPVITVTDNIGSRDCTPIQTQSNISLDEVYAGKNKISSKQQNFNGADINNENKKPEMMTLREYINVLMRQQQVEDERLAILENSFDDCGWCSREDLMNIKQKRIIISKKWAERISFYQNKLDS